MCLPSLACPAFFPAKQTAQVSCLISFRLIPAHTFRYTMVSPPTLHITIPCDAASGLCCLTSPTCVQGFSSYSPPSSAKTPSPAQQGNCSALETPCTSRPHQPVRRSLFGVVKSSDVQDFLAKAESQYAEAEQRFQRQWSFNCQLGLPIVDSNHQLQWEQLESQEVTA